MMAGVPGATVLIDPGNFSHGFEGVTGLSAILITHQQHDHADLQRLPANPQADARGLGVGVRHRGAAAVMQVTTNASYTPADDQDVDDGGKMPQLA
ncbi:metallo-beta-lactamase superfamily protein [Mycolicibacterium vaccae 95051]|nr:metallo-beta-lactamase superfamily protein [Mycolicibacterium vaccae 95051]